MCILIFYVNYIYINNYINCRVDENSVDAEEPIDYEKQKYICGENVYAFILLGGIVYPLVYETIHMFRTGILTYFSNISSIMDVVYILSSLLMSAIHVIENPLHLASRIVMTGVILLSILRTFKFMRIFRAYSPIVTMLSNVIIDLAPFMLFYTTLIALFSLLWGTVGMGSLIKKINPLFYEAFDSSANAGEAYPGVEYKVIGLLLGNGFDVLRTTLGDYACITTSMY